MPAKLQIYSKSKMQWKANGKKKKVMSKIQSSGKEKKKKPQIMQIASKSWGKKDVYKSLP